MTSEKQRKKGYLLPDDITGYQLQCVSLLIPRNQEYQMAFQGALRELTKWWIWEKSYAPGDTRATEAAHYWDEIISDSLTFDQCDPELGCTEFAPNSAIIDWFPNDPYKTPDLIPDGYYLPPWYIAPALNLTGAAAGDVVTDLGRITSGSSWLSPLPNPPRFRVNITGTGVVELHLVTINGGGRAQLQVDGDIGSLRWIDTHRDATSVPPETQDVIVIPVELTTPGDHFIDVTAIPTLNDEVTFLGFGFGLRKVVLCGFDQPPAPGDTEVIFQFDGTRCVLQYSTNAGETWTDVAGWEDFALSCFQGPAGEPGEDGAPGAPGAPGGIDDDATEIPPPDLPPGENARCGVAAAVATAVRDVYYLPVLEAYILETVTNGLSNLEFARLLQSANYGIGIWPSSLPLFIAWLQSIQADDANTLYNNTNTTAVLDAFICELYCALQELNEDTITEEVKQLWLANFIDRTDIDGRAAAGLWNYALSVTLSTLRTEALYAAEAAAGDCDDCGCSEICPEQFINWSTVGATPAGWSSTLILPTVTDPDNTPFSSVFVPGQNRRIITRTPPNAWQDQFAAPGPAQHILHYEFDAPCIVQTIGFGMSGSTTNTKVLGIVLELATGENRVVGYFRDSAPAAGPQSIFVELPEPLEAIGAYLLIHTGGGTGFTHTTRFTHFSLNQPAP